jgi:dTDP-4-dehydrorhamnose reductase
MKVLILGCNGQLGVALSDKAPDGTEVVGFDLPELDISKAAAVLDICRQASPDVVINAAAYTAVDQAESEPELSQAVNVVGPGNIAAAAIEVDARLIHISTDFVFDGEAAAPYKSDAETNPLSVYGRTKRDGEQVVLDAMPENAIVVRTAWLYSKTGSNFVKTMLRLMQERNELSVVSDQMGTPTWADSLAKAVWAFASAPQLSGVFHWTDGGQTTWYEFAVAIQEEALSLGLLDKGIPIHPITSAHYPTAAARPRYSVLSTSDTLAALNLHSTEWRVNLHHMLKGMIT